MEYMLDRSILDRIKQHAMELEERLQSDVMYFNGPITVHRLKEFRNFIEDLGSRSNIRNRLSIFLKTYGGTVEVVEKMVEIIRHFYNEVYFVVPDMALSAGTIFCMSGDQIFMDYSSCLGPIDPQVQTKDGILVPALGYLDMIERLIQKSAKNELTPAEFGILQNQDLAELRSYEQARDLSIALIKKWLVEYKFKDWKIHETNLEKKEQPVTSEEKMTRAEEIASKLGDNKIWHSHGRMIGIRTLQIELRLKINDYSLDTELRQKIRHYNDLLTDYIERQGFSFYLHSVYTP